MSKILEFTPAQESAVTSRVLLLVHRAIDESFPSAIEANRQFTKTVFTNDEKTANNRVSVSPQTAGQTPAPQEPEEAPARNAARDLAEQEFSRMDTMMTKKPGLTWLFALGAVLLVAVMLLVIYLMR